MNKKELIEKYQKKIDYQNQLWKLYKNAERRVDECDGDDYQLFCKLEQTWMSFNVERILTKRRIYKQLIKDLK